MAGLVRMSLDSPEETRLFEAGTGQLQLVDMKEGGVGNEPCVVIDWQGFADYAKR
jgi:hypothetical protein